MCSQLILCVSIQLDTLIRRISEICDVTCVQKYSTIENQLLGVPGIIDSYIIIYNTGGNIDPKDRVESIL